VREIMGEHLRLCRVAPILLFAVVMTVGGIAYSRFAGGTRVIDVKVVSPQPDSSIKGILEGIRDASSRLEMSIDSGSVDLGGDIDEVVALVAETREGNDLVLGRLQEQIVDSYYGIRDIVFRLTAAWVEPESFRPAWFEDPSMSELCAQLARAEGVTQAEIMDDGSVDIDLAANLSLAWVAYRLRWVAAGGESESQGTHILVRDDSSWRFRCLDPSLIPMAVAGETGNPSSRS
jgi:hypothetical protein